MFLFRPAVAYRLYDLLHVPRQPTYKAVPYGDTTNENLAISERNLCSMCSGSDETWPELLHPFVPAIDAPELQPPKKWYATPHLFLGLNI